MIKTYKTKKLMNKPKRNDEANDETMKTLIYIGHLSFALGLDDLDVLTLLLNPTKSDCESLSHYDHLYTVFITTLGSD